jgi:hypothetical protein
MGKKQSPIQFGSRVYTVPQSLQEKATRPWRMEKLLVGDTGREVPLTEVGGVDRLGNRAGCVCWLEFGVARWIADGWREALSGGRRLWRGSID